MCVVSCWSVAASHCYLFCYILFCEVRRVCCVDGC